MNNTVAAQLTLFSLDQPLNSGQLFPNDDLVPSSPELQVLSMATLLPPSFCDGGQPPPSSTNSDIGKRPPLTPPSPSSVAV
ncbi:hypothetical protein ACFX2I_045501 [Malus domestica]